MKRIATEDQSLLEALSSLFPECSKTSLRSWLKEGRITVDGKTVKIGSTPVSKGQSIALGQRIKLAADKIKIYYEDDHLVVVEKPAGLLSVSTNFEKADTLHSMLKKHYRPRKVFVVHRLDQDTSGVMLFALNEKACDRLKGMFEAHDIERVYCAIVEGRLQPEAGTWRSYLYEDPNYVMHSTDNPKAGQLAITHYEVDNQSKKYSALTITLETGRKNQIRVHCKDAGHPVCGDKKYGAEKDPIRRLCLHAHVLAFSHPITKKQMRFVSPIPEAFQKLITPHSRED